MKILATGGTPDIVNSNTAIRAYMAHGIECTNYAPTVKNVCQTLFRQAFRGFRPSAVFICGSIAHPASNVHEITKLCREEDIPLVYWLHDDPYEFDLHWTIDPSHRKTYIFTNEKNCVEYYDRSNVYFMPTAASPLMQRSKHSKKRSLPERSDQIFFCGYGYEERKAVISQICTSELLSPKVVVAGPNWADPPCTVISGRIPPVLLHVIYQSSLFVLNIGRDLNIANSRFAIPASSPGPRTFEAAMMGAVQIYMGQSEAIKDYYTASDGVYTPSNIGELEEIYLHAIQHPNKHATARASAIAKTASHHLYSHRAQAILDIIKQ